METLGTAEGEVGIICSIWHSIDYWSVTVRDTTFPTFLGFPTFWLVQFIMKIFLCRCYSHILAFVG